MEETFYVYTRENEHLGSWDTSCWYGYDIYKSSCTNAEQPYQVLIFTKDYPFAEVASNSWHVSMTYECWFATEDEARVAAEAFVDEMHWRREAEWRGIGEELEKQRAEEIRIGAEKFRKEAEEDTRSQDNS